MATAPLTRLELLAPARDADIGIEAVNHGADAVYIGGPGFGARDKAGNPIEDIARLVTHAHRYNARIFVTLNTILRDDELEGARQLAWQLYEAGVDALIVQDMGLLELDLPPIQLHASTQTDIRTPEKARFLQDVGFSQMVLARELDLQQIRAIKAEVQQAHLEFFVHGALCVAYSGQCFISHAHTGRSANRGSCSQECRLPYTVTDAAGRVIAHDKHVLSLKDNDQSANLEALIDAGIRSFKIEGRYKDMATVKNVTAHYRTLLDAILDRRPELARTSHGRCRFTFTPEPEQAFNRGGTDYFVNGRKIDIGAFDTPKHAGMPLGEVKRVGAAEFDLDTGDATRVVNNGDALTWWDRQGELQGVPVNVATPLGGTLWRIEPNLSKGQAFSDLKDLFPGTAVSRNRDMAWERLLAKPSSERRIALDVTLAQVQGGFELSLKDETGTKAAVRLPHAHEPARDAKQAEAQLKEHLAKLGDTIFEARRVRLAMREPLFLPVSKLNALRREAVAALEAARTAAFERLPRDRAVEPPVPYPDDTLTYLANVYNTQAAAFYARHGVKVIGAAYESHEELGEVPLMITKHCVRWSLSLCPKQAKGVTGVQGTVRAEPLTLKHGDDTLTLRFDCKPCEMHVVGALRKNVLKQLNSQMKAEPLTFYRTRPTA
ncbi:peptidase U32 family protein [Roseateles puraquae]|uniref:Collagenase-like protease n=1 Tax=Roseateles puraquae TaxID=431059 RepID=A0A254NCZ3_9BURK|nr:U32 family peptidase [Roseateles puraquae]MDG0853464.1 U32 family peptidase [Roseateles puraquae]OWR03033.1 collagenase-like protease [Roseateles puraquae]